MRNVIKRFKRAQKMKPTEKIEGQNMNVFKVWVDKTPVDPRIKAVVKYGGKLDGKKKMKEISERNAEIMRDRYKNETA